MMLVEVCVGNGYSNSHHVLSRPKANASARGKVTNKHVKFTPRQAPLLPSLIAAIVVAVSPICNPPANGMGLVSVSVSYSVGESIEEEDVMRKLGGTLFRQTCIGCHDAGGNIIQPASTLFINDLQRNGVDTEEEIYRVTYFGKGRMPGFGEQCTPKGQCTFGPRLSEEDIKLLAKFVKLQADQGWSNSIISGN